MKKVKIYAITSAVLFGIFLLFTVAVLFIDKAPIGPEGTEVGFSSLNKPFAEAVQYNNALFKLTEFTGVLSIGIASGFGCVGAYQLFIKRKSLKRVDSEIILLGLLYSSDIIIYFLFDKVVVNLRPVIVNGELRASYPSSHTVLAICVYVSAMIIFPMLLKNRYYVVIADALSAVLMLVTLGGRLMSGVHWLSDIIASVILSAALLSIFYAGVLFVRVKREQKRAEGNADNTAQKS